MLAAPLTDVAFCDGLYVETTRLAELLLLWARAEGSVRQSTATTKSCGLACAVLDISFSQVLLSAR